MRSITAACAAIAFLIAAPNALAAGTMGPKIETATSGTVSATLTYTMKTAYEASDVRLGITRAGVPATLQGGADPAAGCQECENAIPIGDFTTEGNEINSLTFADLDANGEPELIVDTYTGGAHCCWISAIYGWDPATNQYRHLIKYWADPSYVLKDLNGDEQQEFETADPRFAYTFCAYACSNMPVLIYRYENDALVDVTKEFPAVLRRDATSAEKLIAKLARRKADRYAIRGQYPTLCADLYRLGEGASCRAQLQHALKRGWLSQAPGDKAAHWAGGRKYIAQVLRVLDRYGYR